MSCWRPSSGPRRCGCRRTRCIGRSTARWPQRASDGGHGAPGSWPATSARPARRAIPRSITPHRSRRPTAPRIAWWLRGRSPRCSRGWGARRSSPERVRSRHPSGRPHDRDSRERDRVDHRARRDGTGDDHRAPAVDRRIDHARRARPGRRRSAHGLDARPGAGARRRAPLLGVGARRVAARRRAAGVPRRVRPALRVRRQSRASSAARPADGRTARLARGTSAGHRGNRAASYRVRVARRAVGRVRWHRARDSRAAMLIESAAANAGRTTSAHSWRPSRSRVR